MRIELANQLFIRSFIYFDCFITFILSWSISELWKPHLKYIKSGLHMLPDFERKILDQLKAAKSIKASKLFPSFRAKNLILF